MAEVNQKAGGNEDANAENGGGENVANGSNNDGGGNIIDNAVQKDLIARDKKINELLEQNKKLKEAETARLAEIEKERQANLSTEEKLADVQAKLERQDLLTGYLGMGLTNEQANKILDSKNEIEKASLVAQFKSEQAVESFKREKLDSVSRNEPTPSKGNNVEDAFTKGLKRGMRT